MSEPLVNEHFNDFPIDYFKIKPEDFAKIQGGTNGEVSYNLYQNQLSNIIESTISPNDEGRIYDELREVINLQVKDTTVINASVGQGKTYSILKVVEEYFSGTNDTYIFIAVPFVSLVQQYFNQLVNLGIDEENIYRYEWLDPNHEKSTLEAQKKCRIHIITVNCLLGNAGENSAINSSIKRKYLKEFSDSLKGKTYTYNNEPISIEDIGLLDVLELSNVKMAVNSSNKKKAIFIYDEIHDAINNFKKNNVFNLYHWIDVIEKNIVISATYNDASIVVLKYLSSLTDNKIHIITSERKIIREKQSKLFLHYNSNRYYKNKDTILCNVIKDSIDRELNIDILCYSKKLAEEIYKANDGAGSIMKNAYNENIKLCASELISNQRALRNVTPASRYDSTKCNIGTNFKTGVNIEKDNHSFIIILPPDSSKLPFENLFGIFSSGVNDIIQAFARQRKRGEIHIILPPPERMDFNSLPEMNEVQNEKFIESYSSICKLSPTFLETAINALSVNRSRFNDERVVYKQLNMQIDIVKNKFEEFINSILLPILHHSNLDDYKRFLETPELDDFRIQKGAKVINKDKFLCADLSSFITYSAFTNQFINCRLENYYTSFSRFTSDGLEDELQDRLEEIYETFLTSNNHDLNEAYKNLLDYIFDGNIVYLDDNQVNKGNYTIRQAILKFILNTENSDFFNPTLPYLENIGTKFNHINYLMHILAFISNDRRNNISNTEYSFGITNLYNLRERLKNSLVENNRNLYLLPYSENDIFQGLDINEIIGSLLAEFPLLRETSFNSLVDKTIEQQKESIYNYLSKTLGNFGNSRRLNFSQINLKKLQSNLLNIPFAG